MTTLSSSYLRALNAEYEHCILYGLDGQAQRAWSSMALELLRLMGFDATEANHLYRQHRLPSVVLDQLPRL